MYTDQMYTDQTNTSITLKFINSVLKRDNMKTTVDNFMEFIETTMSKTMTENYMKQTKISVISIYGLHKFENMYSLYEVALNLSNSIIPDVFNMYDIKKHTSDKYDTISHLVYLFFVDVKNMNFSESLMFLTKRKMASDALTKLNKTFKFITEDNIFFIDMFYVFFPEIISGVIDLHKNKQAMIDLDRHLSGEKVDGY